MSLFDSFKVENHAVKNRILVPPYNDANAQKDGKISHGIFDHVMRLIKQGAGTVILDSSYVTQQGRSNSMQLGIAEEDQIPRLRNLVKHMKSEGVFSGIRLSHAGGKTSEKICGEQPIAPSVLNFGKDYDLSRAFDKDDVREICLYFAHAVERAEEAGFDFVEINGSQQQLFDQCLNFKYNNREDEYGGELKNRLRLLCEVVGMMKERVENKIMISYFFPIHDKLEDGFNYKDLKNMLRILEKAGVDLFHIVTIHVMNKFFNTDSTLLEWVSKYTKKPLIVEGNIKSTAVLKETLSLNKATFYAIDKALFNRSNWYQFLQKKITR